MSEADSALDGLQDAIEAYAIERAPELVAEARASAEAKVRSILADALAHSMLEHARQEFAVPVEPPPAPKPARARRRRPSGRHEAKTADFAPAIVDPGFQEREAAADNGYYVYGIVAAEGAVLPAGLVGVGGRGRVELIEHESLAAIASRVSLVDFGEEQLREHLNDVEWLEETARAHEAVLEQALSHMTVVPMRLCTIYRSELQVNEMLDAQRELILDALTRLQGRAEWGVKLIAEPGALARAGASSTTTEDENAPISPGAAYMRGKSREAREREELDRIAENWAEKAHERLSDEAAESLINPIQNPEVSGHVGEMLLNGVYLVANADLDQFRTEVYELADEFAAVGVAVELTGPWPPYNFVSGSIEAAR